MKKRTLIISLTCTALLTGIAVFFVSDGNKRLYPEKPFKNLNTSDIASATVQLMPPDKTIRIVETDELVSLLRDVVLYEKDDSYRECCGQAAVFSLTMADGSCTRLTEYNPFFVIDGVGYRTKYEPCEALNQYANELLNDEDSIFISEEPPALTILSDQTAFGALRGTYSWQKDNGDGTATLTEADSPHPLDCKDLLPLLETTEETAVLDFAWKPDTVKVQCWSDEQWGNTNAESEDVTINGNVITLKPGGYIYEITAEWDTENGYGGTVSYSAYLETI